MNVETLVEILNQDYDRSKRPKDNVLLGMQIITKHSKSKESGVGHDILYYGDLSQVAETITEIEAKELCKLGWMPDEEYDCFSMWT